MFRLTTDPIDPGALEAVVREPECGGIVTFTGSVRDRADDGRSVRALAYEAFEPMALVQFETIAREAAERFGGVRLAIVHRLGEVAVGEIAVAVVAAAEHRQAAFDACKYAIDEVKARAPIWKKEMYADGDARWRANADG